MALVSSLLKFSEYALVLVIVAAAGYIGYFFLTHKNDQPAVLKMSSSAEEKSPEGFRLETKPYAFYESRIKGRDIFGFAAPAAADPAASGTPSGELPAHLKVVGIVIAYPAQVIIEDTDAHQTYFIEEGKAQAGIKIERAAKDKIFINYQNQSIAIAVKGNHANVQPQPVAQ